ncbi:hypothetical protein AVEN_213223-1 [Araneus ventricosus]|uniref:Uncharacterized protein n=1 Tax=Araneus ventricosus TaxID=182803 RepID=A0A4Y2JQZ7_ARAVE|nr:hypothetical protein AVEN_213223-1 [Araneus ventricosus]
MNAVSIPGSEEFEVLSPSCIEIVQKRPPQNKDASSKPRRHTAQLERHLLKTPREGLLKTETPPHSLRDLTQKLETPPPKLKDILKLKTPLTAPKRHLLLQEAHSSKLRRHLLQNTRPPPKLRHLLSKLRRHTPPN